MKKIKTYLFPAVLFGLLFSCNKQETPEPYSNYISVQASKFVLNSDSNKVVQLYIKNDSEKEFERECQMTYSLQNPKTGKYFYSKEILFNKQVPNLPNGVFKLIYRGTYIYTKELNNLKWNNLDYSSIEPGDYLFRAQMFIKDPYSPLNLIHSNILQITKE
jgi:hypothetical protein